ncbi:MAG: hydroxyethylthiazole kinase [Geminicoccaceae bacterium]
MTAAYWAERAATLLDRVRVARPQVHVLTSTVAQNLTANMLLALGADVRASLAPGEVDVFAAQADALLVNLGMFDETRSEAIARALPVIEQRQAPWVLDPVHVEAGSPRAALASSLFARGPSIVRANEDEYATLSSWSKPTGHLPVLVRSGEIDVITGVRDQVRLAGGDPLMARVTAAGCAGTAVLAALLPVAETPFEAAVAGMLILGVAGELAGERATGPASFQMHWLDAVYALDRVQLGERARLA